jgi:TrmH family RNA methyltransferase
VIVSENSADPFSAKALRGSMGSAFRLPIWVNASYKDAFEWARSNGFSTVGSSINASRTYTDLDWKQRRLLILGSEARGIEPEIAAQLTESVTIPMSEKVESLNLAVAAGIIVFEARRQIASAKKG